MHIKKNRPWLVYLQHSAQGLDQAGAGKHAVNKTVTCMDLLPIAHRELTHFRCWLGQKVTQDPAVVAQMPQPSPGGGVSFRYVRASPTASPAEPPKLLPCLTELLSEPL